MSFIIDSQCFPCFNYINFLIKSKYIKIEKYDLFKKMSFRNRYVICGANGLINLTIPITGGREQKTLMKDVLIDNSVNWQIKHWRSLTSSYSKAPYFEFYAEEVKSLIFGKEEFLLAFNMKALDWVLKVLKIELLLGLTEGSTRNYEGEEDFRNYFLPKSFQQTTKGSFPHYSQVFEDRFGFQPNLSILDLIFCEGPNAIHLLQQSK